MVLQRGKVDDFAAVAVTGNLIKFPTAIDPAVHIRVIGHLYVHIRDVVGVDFGGSALVDAGAKPIDC